MDKSIELSEHKKFSVAIWTMLVSTFFVVVADYMIIPYYAIYFTNDLKYSVVFTALALSVFSLSSKGGSFVGGYLTDFYNPEFFINLGFILMIISYASFIFIRTQALFIFGFILLGIGDGCIGISMKYKLISQCKSNAQKAKMFSLLSIAYNMGAMIGPIVGIWMIRHSYKITFCSITTIYFLIYLAIILFTENSIKNEENTSRTIKDFKNIFHHREFMSTLLLVFGFFIIFSQLQFSMPVVTKLLYKIDADTKISMLFMLNGLVIVLFQYPIVKYFENGNMIKICLAGFATVIMSYMTTFVVQYFNFSFNFLYLSIFIFTIGEILFNTFSNSYVASIAPKKNLATYLGFVGLAMGLGNSIGNFMSGKTIDYLTYSHKFYILWIILSGIGIIIILLFMVGKKLIKTTDKQMMYVNENEIP